MLPDPTRLALFAGASLVLLVMPGPAVLYITARSMSEGLEAGLVSVLAVETGNALLALAAALGLAALLSSSALAFSAVRLLGAAYLVFLGVRKIASRSQDGPAARSGPARTSLQRVYLQGVVVAALNPKTALFFLAFLPQFADPARGRVTAQMLLLGAAFVGMALVSDGAYALVAGTVGRWLWRHPRLLGGERYLSGAVYVGLGVFAALSAAGAPRPTAPPSP
ncbi:MAG TPA: LysE family translocator [Anaeromyxobacter sp.]|nr:LysE family translocator [Anaeromyxobacter sp.]